MPASGETHEQDKQHPCSPRACVLATEIKEFITIQPTHQEARTCSCWRQDYLAQRGPKEAQGEEASSQGSSDQSNGGGEGEGGREAGRHELGAAGRTQCLQEGPEHAQDPGDPESLRMAVFKDGGGGDFQQDCSEAGAHNTRQNSPCPGASRGGSGSQSRPSGTAAMLDERS